ncbi:hypothetical protein DB347_12875 [Opitutaceae bacterium EW11]|nr:hypothetical protein DB347_12875 [Opitutaceae bacterium EW11]
MHVSFVFRLCPALLVAWAVLASAGSAQSDLVWDFGTAKPADAPSRFPEGISGGKLTAGNSGAAAPLLSATSPSRGYDGASGHFNAGAAAKTGPLNRDAGGSAYFEFALSPTDGSAPAITTLRFGARSTGTGPREFAVFSSVDGYAAPLATGTLANDSTWSARTVTLTSLTIPRGKPVTYRIYGYGGQGAATGAAANWRIDDLVATLGGATGHPPPPPPSVAIHEIQGPGAASPLAGKTVTVGGVVTASFQSPASGLGGFFIQAPDAEADSDPSTSEGLFVYDNGAPTSVSVVPGDVVTVVGTVVEFGTAPKTLTELTNIRSVAKGGRAALPAPARLSLPLVDPDSLERYEGMRVEFPQTLTVTDNYGLGRYGEFKLSNGRLPQPTNIAAPGPAAVAQATANARNAITLDDGQARTYPNPTPYLFDADGRGPTVRAGDTVTGVVGVLTYAFGNYIVEPTARVALQPSNPRPAEPPAVGGDLRIAIGNVLNFFNGDDLGGGFPTKRGANTVEEYQRQRAKIVAGVLGLRPDIMGLTEVENDGFGPASAIADLVKALNVGASGETYAFVDASAVDNGTDVIHVALIYRPDRVEPVGKPAALSNAYFNGVARPPLAQTFRELRGGQVLTVCINHFRAKGSPASGAASDGRVPNPNLDQGDGQGNNNYVRTKEAQTLAAWLATDPTHSGDPDVLIIGDLNAYAREDPITALEAAGYVNLTERAEGVGGYSYAFQGQYGHLDHALASPGLAKQVTGAATWHLNSDEPPYLDYNEENKSDSQKTLNVGTPYRYSDHDPVLVGFSLK